MTRNFSVWKRALLTVGLALAGLALVWNGTAEVSRAGVKPLSIPNSPAPNASYLYLFMPGTQTFITMPLSSGALPTGVAVSGTNPTHVWVTEYGLNRIAHVVFTSTTSYTLAAEYSISAPTNSGPFLITVDGANVWFTEREANRVGRLNTATGHIDEFDGHGLPANAGLADLNAAPDGSIWIAGQYAKRLYRLVITSTVDYAFQEYPTRPPSSLTLGPADPFGIDVVVINPPTSYQIAFAAPMSNSVGLLTPGSREVQISSGIPPGYAPTDIVYDVSYDSMWFTEPSGGALGLSFKGTLGTAPRQFVPLARPVFLTRMVNNTLWVSQQDGLGQLGRFVFTPPGSHQFTSYPLPLAGLRPTGVALADNGGVWLAAYETQRIFLPAILR